MSVTFLLADDATPATALAFGPTAAGATSATQVLHMWNAKGTPGGSIQNLSIQAIDPATGLDSGVNWLDQNWLDVRVAGGLNPGNDPTFAGTTYTTDWFKVGAGVVLPLLDLPGNCAYFVEVRLHPAMKDGTATETVNFKLIANYNESSLSLAGAIADLGQGIVTGLGDFTVTEWVEAPTVTATGTPDAVVHVGARWFIYRGASVRVTATDDLTLDQNDAATVALTTGNEYKAVLSQPAAGAAVVTKGLLAATGAGVTPALPAGNLLGAVVTVKYGATGSVIAAGDIVRYAADGRGKPSVGALLTVNVAAVRAILSGSRVINRSARVVAVYPSTTSYGWLRAPDVVSVQNSPTPAFNGAVPLFSCVADGTHVTSVTDLRQYAGARRAANLDVYANNAAAIAGGLGPGDLFRTSADPAVVCVCV